MDDLDRMVKIFRIGLFILCALIFATCAEVFAGCVYPDTGYAMGESNMKPIVDAATFDTVYTPENGDAASANDLETGTIQPLADRTKFLKDSQDAWATYKLKAAAQLINEIGSVDWEIVENPSGMFGINGSDNAVLPSSGIYMISLSVAGIYSSEFYSARLVAGVGELLSESFQIASTVVVDRNFGVSITYVGSVTNTELKTDMVMREAPNSQTFTMGSPFSTAGCHLYIRKLD